jgi:threonine/homoserine/homoserine lactone efflux protein
MPFPVDPQRFAAYLGVMVVLALTPGPANVFQIALGAQKGPLAAVQSAAGMNLATGVWYLAAGLGLGVLAQRFPAIFPLLTLVGAAYLVGLSAKAFAVAFRQEDPHAAEGPEGATPAKAQAPVVQGFLVQIANPKILLFFGAVLPPFLDLRRALPPQLVVFAAATIALDMLSMSAYGLSGAAIARRMAEPRFARGFAAATGLLLLIAAGLALMRR